MRPDNSHPTMPSNGPLSDSEQQQDVKPQSRSDTAAEKVTMPQQPPVRDNVDSKANPSQIQPLEWLSTLLCPHWHLCGFLLDVYGCLCHLYG